RRVHATRLVTRERAPERIPSRHDLEDALGPATRVELLEANRLRAHLRRLHDQGMRVHPEVHELDAHAPRADALPRKGQRPLLLGHLYERERIRAGARRESTEP